MIVLEVGFLFVFWAWVFVAALFLRNTVLPRWPLAGTPDAFGLPAETVQFPSTDGLRLEGWKIPSAPSQPWVILCHGLGSNRSDLLDIAAALHAQGFNLLLFDFRGHGGSAGRVTSFGWTERRDLEGALAFLGRQGDVPARPCGVYGISMGGAVALMVAAKDERLGAVAVDSPYTDLEDSLGRHLALLYRLPAVPALWMVAATYRLRFGVWPRAVSPLESARHLAPRPVLVVHGAADPRMPLAGARAIAEAASGPGVLWVIKGAGHLEGFAVDPEGYTARLGEFFGCLRRVAVGL